ncbi:MAG: hypothetical protein DWQ01_18765 [Planctomycetota bacterium]|nr:MAG: hypothetical protein DWQ01_18765 [Planctomycetota bacterium]
MSRVEDFPDVLPLEDHQGNPVGLFRDHGAWFGLRFGRRATLEVCELLNPRRHLLHLGADAVRHTIWADALEAELENGARIRAAFASEDAAVVEYLHGEPPDVFSDLPFEVVPGGEGRWLVVVAPEGGAVRDPDAFERNRHRWNDWFARAFHQSRFQGWRLGEELLARAVTTLMWNWLQPKGDLGGGGVLSSPFTEIRFWAWDSWKHAHALSFVDPRRGVEQLRTMLSEQDAAGMIPDTACYHHGQVNWRNTKPPQVAWALEALWWSLDQDPEILDEWLYATIRSLEWWDLNRRCSGEILVRPGGKDFKTAVWDSGWDDSVRFQGVEMVPHGSWRLLDTWPVDLNCFSLVECEAAARLTAAGGWEPLPWQLAGRQFRRAIGEFLWNPKLAYFADFRPSQRRSITVQSAATWLPAWARMVDSEQAQSLREQLLDPTKFNTPTPFPSLAADSRPFQEDGFWNGSVWLDYAAMAIAWLGEDGEEPARRLLETVHRHGALFECYGAVHGQPCHGERRALAQFAGTAAAIVELAHGGPLAHPYST